MDYPHHWNEKNTFLTRVFEFKDYTEAINFVCNIVPLAEKMNHHPDIEIFSYNKVRIKMHTHDADNQITERDTKMARAINELLV
jgi:4a-hydroxytetrahydrobiopterin dehydratase